VTKICASKTITLPFIATQKNTSLYQAAHKHYNHLCENYRMLIIPGFSWRSTACRVSFSAYS